MNTLLGKGVLVAEVSAFPFFSKSNASPLAWSGEKRVAVARCFWRAGFNRGIVK